MTGWWNKHIGGFFMIICKCLMLCRDCHALPHCDQQCNSAFPPSEMMGREGSFGNISEPARNVAQAPRHSGKWSEPCSHVMQNLLHSWVRWGCDMHRRPHRSKENSRWKVSLWWRAERGPSLILLLKVSSARFKGKPKPHLHIKNCLVLYPRAGGLTLLLCIYVPGLAVPCVCMGRKKRKNPLSEGDMISTAIPNDSLLPQSLCWEESYSNNANAEIKILDGDWEILSLIFWLCQKTVYES